uniref:Uncharacterized protein n=1 Tax=Cacopsylla melanoneura TaxID=428564 RepID=A0A8D8LYY0_9HEMI
MTLRHLLYTGRSHANCFDTFLPSPINFTHLSRFVVILSRNITVFVTNFTVIVIKFYCIQNWCRTLYFYIILPYLCQILSNCMFLFNMDLLNLRCLLLCFSNLVTHLCLF